VTAPVRAIAVAALGILSACWTAALRTIPETRSVYDDLPSEGMRLLAQARAELERGETEGARASLAGLSASYPRNIPVGILLQEAELRLAAARRGPETAAEGLRERYRKRAEEARTVESLVFAARLEPDPLAAAVLLERGESLDPQCAWCPYGLAWSSARAGDWAGVRAGIARAKAADPGHMPTLWLETWMLSRSGNLSEAIVSLDTWIEAAARDPRIDSRLVLDARLDRALLAVLDGDSRQALRYLESLGDERIDRARLKMIQAGAQQGLGEVSAALAAAQEAEALDAQDLLPVVQQALLHEMWIRDSRAAEADWSRALEIAKTDPTLGSLLEVARARVRLERFAAERIEAGAGDDRAGDPPPR